MTGSGVVAWIDAESVARLLPMPDAIDVLETALADGLDPSADPPRTVLGTRHGQLLLMPAETKERVGVKIVSVAPGNAEQGLPRIQGIYLLMDAQTLAALALLDGIAITSLRTPAASAVAVRHLASADSCRLVVFGTGPQAGGHIAAVRAVRELAEVVVVGRDPGRTESFLDRLAGAGVHGSLGTPDAVAGADIVICATTAGESLFDGRLIADSACVVAVGSHEPHRRELDAHLLGRSTVVVEDVSTALREAGDVVLAISDGAMAASQLVTIADVVTGRTSVDPNRPRVYKSVGMAWQDLVVAAEIHKRLTDA
jgi:ornithine cyclodeaminase/alanine dehydrogenase-like protein (mu-crystallin family)